MKLLRLIGLGLGMAAGLAAIAGIWAVWFAAPPIDIITAGPAVRIDTRYLGEGYVASSLIEITGSDGGAVLRLTSPMSECTSDLFVFAAGVNDVPALASGTCAVEVPPDARTFVLDAGETYTFTVEAINDVGYHRKASRRFTVPGDRSRVAPAV